MFTLAQVRKALVPVVVAAVCVGLAHIGVVPTPTVTQTVTLVVTAAIVYFVPNSK